MMTGVDSLLNQDWLGGLSGEHGVMKAYKFVFKTEVKHYYTGMDHDTLLAELKNLVADKDILRLLEMYMKRIIYDDGFYLRAKKGISLGCPLSPLMGAVYLKRLDERMDRADVFYVRYMDDWLILPKTRWKLRKIVKIVNQTLEELCVEKRPVFVGKISQGFDFLGYNLSDKARDLAKKTIGNFVDRLARLQEQEASASRLGEYVRHWITWSKGELDWTLPFIDWLSDKVNAFINGDQRKRATDWPDSNEHDVDASREGSFARALNASGVRKDPRLHTLRHSFAARLCVDFRYIRALLGHSSPKTTEIHTHIGAKGFENIKAPLGNMEI